MSFLSIVASLPSLGALRPPLSAPSSMMAFGNVSSTPLSSFPLFSPALANSGSVASSSSSDDASCSKILLFWGLDSFRSPLKQQMSI
jgi:hypothetical protein